MPIRYPWDTWFKRKQFRLLRTLEWRPGHFDCRAHGMAAQVRNAASARGLAVSVRIGDDDLIVTVRPRGVA
jgi:hypothetical protein